jgi:gliding motility-associated-like protein
MKTLITILLALIANLTLSQMTTNNNVAEYRVVAHKYADNSVESISNTVGIIKKIHIQVPNAFSPDGDGVNDNFTAVSEGVEEFSMDIYNRWGEVVYHSENIEEPWAGKYKGADCQQDAYVYVISARGLADELATTLKGTVSLIR